MDKPALETERLRLYPMSELQLAQALYDLRGVARSFGAEISGQGYGFFEMMSKRRVYRAKLSLINQAPDAWLLSTMWLIADKETGEMVGEAGFKGLPRSGEVEIGYGTRLPFRSKGYMTEAVGAMCSFVFSHNIYGVSSVCALTNPDNSASHRVLQKNGFVREGTRGRYWYWRKEKI